MAAKRLTPRDPTFDLARSTSQLWQRFWRWLSAVDQLSATRRDLEATLALLEAERSAVTRLEAEKAAQEREIRLYRKFAGQIDEARDQLGREDR